MSTAPKKVKTAAAQQVPQNRDECAAQIRQLGDVQREIDRQTTAMNDEIAVITQKHQPELARLNELAAGHSAAIKTWCEANRKTLTDGDKVKTVNLVTGEVSWKKNPPSVTVRGVEAVLEALKRLRLKQFIRIKEEVNKEAILADDKKKWRNVTGITVNTDAETFSITPFEQEAA
ncbi:MAG: hypothetical protein RL375_2618 [Pseudomonadota bacterium]